MSARKENAKGNTRHFYNNRSEAEIAEHFIPNNEANCADFN